MKRAFIFTIGLIFLAVMACSDRERFEVTIPDFDFPKTVTFEQNLSAYNIFQGTPASLIPSDDYQLLELSSILFTDYAHKQRLVKVPPGTQMTRLTDGTIDFPDGTILVKTFYYYNDERDMSFGKRVIESRLLIKESNTWNVATYLWNEEQTDATLELSGHDTQVSWINTNGDNVSTLYHVPDENECIACHQSNATMTPLGTKLRNLNRLVERDGASLNQIDHLQSAGILSDFSASEVAQIVDYSDGSLSQPERARAYLDLNCAHCHNPTAWEAAARQELDFRYETTLGQSGILDRDREISDLMSDGEMPFIGTTILDAEGVSLINAFLESL